jgi:hypothetical protein
MEYNEQDQNVDDLVYVVNKASMEQSTDLDDTLVSLDIQLDFITNNNDLPGYDEWMENCGDFYAVLQSRTQRIPSQKLNELKQRLKILLTNGSKWREYFPGFTPALHRPERFEGGQG